MKRVIIVRKGRRMNLERNFMKKNVTGIVLLILIGAAYIFIRSQMKENVLAADKHFKVIDKGDFTYEYKIFNNKSKVVIQNSHYGTIPDIHYIESDIIEVSLSDDSYTYSCLYYDIANDRISDQYISPLATKYGRITYFDNDRASNILMVSSIFDSDMIYRELSLDISEIASPIIDAEFLDEETLYIKYLSGEMQIEESIRLSLAVEKHPDSEAVVKQSDSDADTVHFDNVTVNYIEADIERE